MSFEARHLQGVARTSLYKISLLRRLCGARSRPPPAEISVEPSLSSALRSRASPPGERAFGLPSEEACTKRRNLLFSSHLLVDDSSGVNQSDPLDSHSVPLREALDRFGLSHRLSHVTQM